MLIQTTITNKYNNWYLCLILCSVFVDTILAYKKNKKIHNLKKFICTKHCEKNKNFEKKTHHSSTEHE